MFSYILLFELKGKSNSHCRPIYIYGPIPWNKTPTSPELLDLNIYRDIIASATAAAIYADRVIVLRPYGPINTSFNWENTHLTHTQTSVHRARSRDRLSHHSCSLRTVVCPQHAFCIDSCLRNRFLWLSNVTCLLRALSLKCTNRRKHLCAFV